MLKSLKNKKIVILVISDFIHDARVLKEAKSAQKAGMKVTILTKKTPGSKFIEKRDGYRIVRVETFIDKYIFSLYLKLFKKSSPKTINSKLVDKKMSLFEGLGIVISVWFTNRAFVKEALKIKPDIVHANDPATLIAAYKIKQLTVAKITYDSHELYLKLLKFPHPIWLKFFESVEKKINQVDGILSVNPYILAKLNRNYGVSKIPQSVVLNSPLYQKGNLKKSGKIIKILYIGKIDRQRGVVQFANAISGVKNIEFSVLGTNLNQYGINSLPMVSSSEVVDIASNYDIGVIPFVHSSQSVYHSLPNKLFEYMMAGLAIVSSDLPEIKKVIIKHQNGITFDPKSKKDVITQINYLVKNPGILSKFKQNSLKAAKEYCWENQEKKQLKMYERLLS